MAENKYSECLCGANDYAVIFEKAARGNIYEIAACRSCQLARTFPMPDDSQEKYKNYGRDTADLSGDSEIRMLQRIKKNRSGLMKRIFRMINRHMQKGRLLEIGCGFGFLLKIAKNKGFDVVGTEYDKFALDYVNALLGQAAVFEPDKILFSEKEFDCIILAHVIEHLGNPKDLFKDVRRYLKDSGILVLAFPNFESPLAQIKRENWEGLQPWEHVWQFGVSSATKILKSYGFTVVDVKKHALYRWGSLGISLKDAVNERGTWKHIIYVFAALVAGAIGFGDSAILILKKS
jgi:2-polyprenyl-3-methyl-5-hydroxy-6-metoxy-1,4-benzoquinol methylase